MQKICSQGLFSRDTATFRRTGISKDPLLNLETRGNPVGSCGLFGGDAVIPASAIHDVNELAEDRPHLSRNMGKVRQRLN